MKHRSDRHASGVVVSEAAGGPFHRTEADAPLGRDSALRVDVDDVAIKYRASDGSTVEAVNSAKFSVRDGEFFTLIGPSGCGKTSVLRAIGGLLRPSGGTVTVSGSRVTATMPDEIAFIFQDFALFPWRTALANVEIALQLKGVDRKDRRVRALEALHKVGLGDVADRYPRQLSGGMQQRVAVARALVSDCRVLLLDEPFGALDEQTRLVLGAQLLTLLESMQKTIVFVTHSLQEAVYLSDRIAVFSSRPSTIKEVIEVDIPRPRTPEHMNSPRSLELQAHLFQMLYKEIVA